ncbi:MAG: amino acid adenylation domain-containing protein [Myxococcales bacterium]|nr:amino acid adenylation domain-containing protein [Myxococcales bacterium]
MSDADRTDLHIAVVGMSARFAGANDPDSYWRNLRDGVESITDFDDDELRARGVSDAQLADRSYVKRAPVLDDMEGFDAAFFGFNPKEGAIMDPQHRHFLECAWEALESAGHPPDAIDGRVGVFAGNGMHAYMMFNLVTNRRLMDSEGLFLVRHTGNDKDFLATRVSYHLDLRGPSVSVQTACSTSLVAIHMATQSLLNGESDYALAGGVTIELPHRVGYHYKHGEILSPDGHCRPFDADSLGTLFGSGCGVVVLRRLQDALDDNDTVHAIIRATAINNDGSSKVGYLAPSVDGQAQCVTECIALADVDPESITYVECHGTGTPVGDPIEVTALTQAFRSGTDAVGYCGIGSVKANIGHTDTAAGVASIIKVVQALKHRQLPPSLNFTSPNPAIDWESTPFFVNAELRPWEPNGWPRRAGVSSLGVGGTNAHVILEEAPDRAPADAPARDTHLFVLSAKTRSALDAAATRLADAIERGVDGELADVEWTLQVGRAQLPERRAVACDAAGAIAALRASTALPATRAPEGPRSVAFMFAGGGAQYPNMGRGLYDTEPAYRVAVDECLRLLRPMLDYDLRAAMFPPAGGEAAAHAELRRPTRTLPSLFVTQYAQAKLWMSWGIEPAALIGHSMGEYTAACLSGLFSLRDALGIVVLRGQLFEAVEPGAMLSVQLDADDLQPRLGDALSLAAVNAPGLALASGPIAAIDALRDALERDGIHSTPVHIEVAAHSAMLDPILGRFRAHFATVRFGEPSIPFVSNLSGEWADPDEVATADYWVRHLRETVRFGDGVKLLLEDPSRVLLEVGPGRTLATLARLSPARQPQHVVLNSLRHPEESRSDAAFVLGVLGDLWAAGVQPDWARFHNGGARWRVDLPTYAWDHQRLWIEGGREAYRGDSQDADGARDADPSRWTYEPAWDQLPLAAPPESPTGPVVVFSDGTSLGAAVLRAAERAHVAAVPVVEGPHFARVRGALRHDPSSRADHAAVWRAVARPGASPAAIIDLRPAAVTADTALDEARARAFDAPFHLANVLASGEPVRWVVVTAGAQEVAGEGGLVPAQALALGPATVAGAELSHVASVALDVRRAAPESADEDRLADAIVREALAAARDRVVALRGGRRFVQTVVRTPIREAGATGPRPHRVAVITGGLGGLGLAAAGRLAAPGVGLALLGRRGLPPRADWDRWVRTHDAREVTRARIEAVRALEERGARVVVVEADVASEADLVRALESVRRTLGPVTDVLHTAGVLDDDLMIMKSLERTRAVLAPKVEGTLALAAALASEPQARVVAYSSVSALLGMPGQADYAAANAFLGTFCRAARSRGRDWTAIGWPAWRDVGMAAAYAGAQAAFDPTSGSPVSHPLLDRRVRDVVGHVSYVTRFDARECWLLDEHRLRSGTSLIPGTGYLELARAAITDGSPADSPVELRDVFFVAPFLVDDAHPRALRLDLRRREDGAAAFAFSSGGAELDSVTHVEGVAALCDWGQGERLDLAAIRSRCSEVERLPPGPKPDANLSFGRRWSNLREIAWGSGEALATLELDAELEGELAAVRLHPALLDFATAGAQRLAGAGAAPDAFYVPVGYGRLRFCGTMPRRLVSHIRLRPSSDPELAVYEVTIATPDGTPVAHISEFTMRRIAGALSLGAPPEESAPLGGRAARAGGVEESLARGVGVDEGLDALERLLSADAPPELYVSPTPLAPQLERKADGEGEAEEELAVGADDGVDADFVAPRTDVERTIASIWRDALGVRAIGAHSSFFELGGHSLVAIRITSRINQAFGVELPLRTLFEAPTVAELAAEIEAVAGVRVPEGTDRDAAARVSVTGDHPVLDAVAEIERVDRASLPRPSVSQEGLWFVDQLHPSTTAYNVSMGLRLRGTLDVAALQSALSTLVARHESMRLVFEPVEGAPRVRVLDAVSVVLDVQQASDAREFVDRAAAQPFDLAAGPLFRAALGRLASDDHVLVITLHHIVSDEWSLEILYEELGEAYAAALEGRPARLPELQVQYVDFAVWHRERLADGRLANQLRYWRSALEGAPTTLQLPADRSRPPVQGYRGARYVHAFDADVAAGMRALAQRQGVTMYVAMLAAFYALLTRLTGQDDLLVGTPSSTRTRAELERVVGFFVNTLVLRGDVSGDPSFEELVGRTRAMAMDAFAAPDLPFDELVRALSTDRDPSRGPLYQVMFALFPSSRHASLPGLECEPVDVDAGGAPVDLTLYMSDGETSLRGIFEYDTALFDEATVAGFGRAFAALLRGIVADPRAPVTSLPTVDADARALLLDTWCPPRTHYDRSATLHGLVEQQRRRTPDAVAVEAHLAGTWQPLTYRQLDERANQLAAHLRKLGVGPRDFVGVCLHRTLQLPVTLLAILKVGATYLPLDPSFPADRLEYMIADAAAPAIVTELALLDHLPPHAAEVVVVDRDAADIATRATRKVAVDVDPTDLAYVIYTSGSTGKPKGVQVPHGAVVNFLDSMAREPGFSAADRLLAVTTISFDISVLELFLPLATGGRVVLVDKDVSTDGQALAAAIVARGVTVLQATPATWRLMLQAGWRGAPLRALCGGEPLPKDLAHQLLGAVDALWNMYGPTETTIWSTTTRITDPDDIHIGHPIANTRCYVVDARRQLVPPGVPGVLWIGGDGVTRGYNNRPDLTDARFVEDPFSTEPGARMYDTGDLVRWRRDGALEYLARVDNQVKVRGFRVELGEIEAVVAKLPGIRRVVVSAHDFGGGDVRLVGYVVPDGPFEAAAVREGARRELPEYMVPTLWTTLDALPLTANGKVDRKALPKPGQTDKPAAAPPRTEAGRWLASVWAELLHVDAIGGRDNFFDLGGHSLLAMRMIHTVAERTGRRLNPLEVSLQTLDQLAASLPWEGASAGAADSSAGDRAASSASTAGAAPHRAPTSEVDDRASHAEPGAAGGGPACAATGGARPQPAPPASDAAEARRLLKKAALRLGRKLGVVR